MELQLYFSKLLISNGYRTNFQENLNSPPFALRVQQLTNHQTLEPEVRYIESKPNLRVAFLRVQLISNKLKPSHSSSKVQASMDLDSKFNSSIVHAPYHQSSKLGVNSNFWSPLTFGAPPLPPFLIINFSKKVQNSIGVLKVDSN